MKIISESYEKYKKAFERSLVRTHDDLEAILTDYSHDFNIRYKKSIERRIKSLDSLLVKANRNGIEDIFRINDIVGIRILVFNKTDAYNLLNLIDTKWNDREITKEDYIKNPKPSGYRAIHLNMECSSELKGEKVNVPTEIQIKTLAQDLWSVLSHEDLYKQDGQIPDIISQFSGSLGSLLDVVDNQGQYIREFMTSKIVISKDLAFDEKDTVDKEILAKIIYDEYGFNISEEEYRIIIKYLEAYNILTVDLFRKLIIDKTVSEAVINIFDELGIEEPLPLEIIVYSSTVYLKYLADDYLDRDLLIEEIKNDLNLTDNQCQECGRHLTDEEVSFCFDRIEDMNYVCSSCLGNYSDCGRCGNMTNNDDVCNNCLDHYMDRK